MNFRFIIMLMLFCPWIRAEIQTDASLGAAVSLMPQQQNYLIPAELGQQKGNNLFHSFKTFIVNNNETAIFQGHSSIQRVITRVTGGLPSQLNGNIRFQDMPHADWYFFNPAGLSIGQQANFDIQGSLYLSGADYLRHEQALFQADLTLPSQLSTAPPSAFGFLKKHVTERAHLQVGDKNQTAPQVTEFNKGSTLLLSAPFLDLNNTALKIDQGKIILVSQTEGEVLTSATERTTLNGGRLRILDDLGYPNKIERKANLDTPGGGIQLYASSMEFKNARLYADTVDQHSSQGLLIRANNNIDISGQSRLTSENIKTAQSQGGDIDIQAKGIKISEGSQIATSNQSDFTAGHIILNVDKLNISGAISIGKEILASGLNSNTVAQGRAGDIQVQAQQTTLSKFAEITASTAGEGQGGDIHLQSQDLLLTDNAKISNSSTGIKTGEANIGEIQIISQKIDINNAAAIRSNTLTAGQGGQVYIQAGSLNLSAANIESGSNGRGNGGQISIKADTLNLQNNAFISSNAYSSGQAGNINLQTHSIRLKQSNISSSSAKSGGGNIDITNQHDFYLQNSQLSTDAKGLKPTDAGGNINIQMTDWLVLDRSLLISRAVAGNGGNMLLQSEQIVRSASSRIDASSVFALAGQINIQAPENDLANVTNWQLPSLLSPIPLQSDQCHLIQTPSTPSIFYSEMKTYHQHGNVGDWSY